MKRTAPPVEMTASELRPLVHASESNLLFACDLGILKLAAKGGTFMGFTIESTFWVEGGDIERIKAEIAHLRGVGVMV